MLYWSSIPLSMYNFMSIVSEGMLWSFFLRLRLSPYKFCSFMFVMNLSSVVSLQYCHNESTDTESGVFVRCPAKKLWELVLIIMMSSEESPSPVTCVLFGSFTGRCTTASWMQQASFGG